MEFEFVPLIICHLSFNQLLPRKTQREHVCDERAVCPGGSLERKIVVIDGYPEQRATDPIPQFTSFHQYHVFVCLADVHPDSNPDFLFENLKAPNERKPECLLPDMKSCW